MYILYKAEFEDNLPRRARRHFIFRVVSILLALLALVHVSFFPDAQEHSLERLASRARWTSRSLSTSIASMPWKSKWSVEVPTCSLPSYLFPSQVGSLGDTPLIIDGERPDVYLTHTTYRDWAKRLAAGLRKAGFRPGDRLLLFSGNTIFFSVVQFGTIMAGGIFTGANVS